MTRATQGKTGRLRGWNRRNDHQPEPVTVVREARGLFEGRSVTCRRRCPAGMHRLLKHRDGGWYVHCPRGENGSYRY